MSDISDEAVRNRVELAEIKNRLSSGQITREQAKLLSKPIIDRVNRKAHEIAARNGRQYKPIISFISAMRNDYGDIAYQNRFVVDESDLIITSPTQKNRKQRENTEDI